VFEVRQRITDPALTTHEACGGPVHRLLSAAPFILKGGGWYVTDYPSESRKKAMESEKSTSTPASSDKPAAKADGAKSDGAKSDGGASSSSSTSSGASAAPAAPKAD